MDYGDQMRFDKRLIDRNLTRGVITREEYQRHLNRLKDLQNESEILGVDLVHIDRRIPSSPKTDEDEL